MNTRQQNLLKFIVLSHVKTAEPVGSKFISEQNSFNFSPATIRNEMSALEEDGYIYQPHTSAGRVPTESGYQFFVDNFLTDSVLPKKIAQPLDELAKADQDAFQVTKSLAKEISRISDNAVFATFGDSNFFYTGISNLFSQPEFKKLQLIYSVSKVIDHLDQVIENNFRKPGSRVAIRIGSQNPFGQDCSALIVGLGGSFDGILGILGPLRMDYQLNQSLLSYSQKLINNLRK